MASNNLVNTKMDLIASLVQKELKESASLLPFVTDYSALAGKGVKQIEIPTLSSFTVQSRAFGGSVSENSALTDGTDVIALDQNKIILFGYDSKDAVQSSIDYLMMASQRAGSAHGRDVNSTLITEWEAVADLNINGAVPADITTANILDMREKMLDNYADMSNVALILGPDQEKVMLGLAEFSRYDYRGDGASPIVNGRIGSVYGVPVFVHTQVKAQQAFMIEKSGCGVAFQSAPSIEEQQALQYGTGGRQVAVDQLYGVGGLQLGQGDAGAGKSPLIAKLAD